MTTPNQNQNIESEIVDSALENEEISEEQLESIAGGKKRQPRLKNAAAAAEIANNVHDIYKR